MLERRHHHRNRVYYGGTVAFNGRNSTLDCVVRNFSPCGARIEFENAAMLPDSVDFEVARKGLTCLARLVWRDHNAAGRDTRPGSNQRSQPELSRRHVTHRHTHLRSLATPPTRSSGSPFLRRPASRTISAI